MSANIDNLAVVHQTFKNLLTNLTPAQMSNFTQQLRAGLITTTKLDNPMSPPELNQYGLMAPVSGNLIGRDKRAARAKVKEAIAERRKLRPLNAFIAFRSYYSSQLPGLPQKTKSGLIRSLWEQDHWKHFWAIAAKAYSELRDNHMGEITLESFLKNVTGFLGVIPAAQYLEAMGWILATDTEGQVHLTKSTSTAEGENVPLISNLSVRDVVNHCYQIGLLARPQRSARSNNNIATMTMSFAAAPKAASTGPTKMQSHTSDGQDARGREVGDVLKEAIQTSLSTVRELVSGNIRSDYNPSIGAVIAEQQGALEAYPSQYPYTLHFHPDIQQPALAFDPAVVQDDFDPFDVFDYINFDM